MSTVSWRADRSGSPSRTSASDTSCQSRSACAGAHPAPPCPHLPIRFGAEPIRAGFAAHRQGRQPCRRREKRKSARIACASPPSGPIGAGARVPGEDVEMREGRRRAKRSGGGTAPPRSSRRSGSPAMWLRSATLEESQRIVGLPEAAAARPDRGPSAAAARAPAANASSSVKKGGRSGPSATRAAPVSVAIVTMSAGASSSASASASASTSRPSASVLPISTVSPLRLLRTSPGRKARPGDGVLRGGDEDAQPDLQARRP